jgi:FAD/FMN-containing dehydrogenase
MRRREFLTATVFATAAAASPIGFARAQSGTSGLSSVDALLLNGGHTTISGASLQGLRDALHGRLLLPMDDGYEDARRIVTRRFDRRPAFIVQATGASDVRIAVDFARENQLLLAVKGGGHSEAGVSAVEGGMMIDLSAMRGVRIDAEAKRAWVQGGTLAGLIDHEALSQGLIVPLGDASTVGIGGLATGGGFGRVSRKFGLTLDSIRSIDLVSADGKLRHADNSENPDLFWAVRGGGGNFGVVTAFEFELHPMEARVVGGNIVFPFAQAHEVLSAYADFTAAAPDELYVECFINVGDTMDASFLQLGVCYSGDERDAERILAPLQRFGTATRNSVTAQNYLALQGSDQQPNPRLTAKTTPAPRDFYYKAGFAAGINKHLIEAIAGGAEPHPGRNTRFLFQPAGGAIARVENAATAFSHRSVSHDTIATVSWLVDSNLDKHGRYAESFWNGIERHMHGFYNNDMAGAVSPRDVAANFGDNYDRLRRVKQVYDPGNMFRLNANVEPPA